MKRDGRPTLACYWAGACGGCDVAILDLDARALDLEREFEIVYWPALTDAKTAGLEARNDRSIDVCLLNGAMRTEHDLAMARLLRRKSRVMVAFGSCAQEGCVPGLANLAGRDALFAAVYGDAPPAARTPVVEGELDLPRLESAVVALDQVVVVDATVPGCPPEAATVGRALDELLAAARGARAPAAAGVLGTPDGTVCQECPLERSEERVAAFARRHQRAPRPGRCLLEEALVCSGPVTRAGCGALCPRVAMGCRGCYGAPEGVEDAGARMIGVLAAMVKTGSVVEPAPVLEEHITSAMQSVADPAGTLYRFSLAHSTLRRARVRPAGNGVTDDEPHHD